MVELFIGLTTWDDEYFISACLQSIRNCFGSAVEYTVFAIDNESIDKSCEIARSYGCQVLVRRCSQADALNMLLDRSTGTYTLLLHSDVALLGEDLWPLLRDSLGTGKVLASPEDIGIGEFERKSYGAGMPESSFMFWKTEEARRLRSFRAYRNWNLRDVVKNPARFLPRRRFDFYGPHITHRIPALLVRNGLQWVMMDVHPSPKTDTPWYVNKDTDALWQDEWGRFVYGFGNFYSLRGRITHYHNWLIRQLSPRNPEQRLDGAGLPMAYIRQYTDRFLKDFREGSLSLPSPQSGSGSGL